MLTKVNFFSHFFIDTVKIRYLLEIYGKSPICLQNRFRKFINSTLRWFKFRTKIKFSIFIRLTIHQNHTKMEDAACPKCKSTKYRNPSMKLMVNVCGHALCESCVELLFVKGENIIFIITLFN